MLASKFITMKQVDTKNAPAAIGPYSQAVISSGFVFVSGQIPIDPKTGLLLQSDIRLQTIQVLKNVESVLQASNSSISKIVRVDIFVIDMDHFSIVNEEYANVMIQSVKPARQTVEVSKLPMGALIEMSCIAISE